MSALPKGWEFAQLGSLLHRIEAGLNVKCIEQPPSDDEAGLVKISAVTWGKFNELQSKTLPSMELVDERNRILPGDLLISRANTIELVGASVIVGEIKRRLYLSDKVLRLVVSENSKRWINYALKHPAVRKEIEGASSGNQLSMRNISQEKLRGLIIPLAPLPEQKRIADKLDATLARVDACRSRLERVQPILKRFRQSVLAAATSGQLTADWRNKQWYGHAGNDDKGLQGNTHVGNVGEASPDGAKQSDNASGSFDLRTSASQVPLHWKKYALGTVAKFVDYRGKTPAKTESGIPLITAKNVRPGYVSFEPREFIADDAYAAWMTRGFPKVGDVLITTEAPLGYVAVIDWEFKFALAQRVICLQFNEVFLGQFASIVMQSNSFQAELREQSTGTTVAGIKASRLKEIEIPAPSIEEQTEIVRRVETLFTFADRLEARLASATVAAERLTPALLAKAFRGELVPQDPNDEPASELLKRLAAQRAMAGDKPKRGRKASV